MLLVRLCPVAEWKWEERGALPSQPLTADSTKLQLWVLFLSSCPCSTAFFHQLAHLGRIKWIKSSGFFLLLAYVSSEYILVFFGWKLLLQLLGSLPTPPPLLYSQTEKLEWSQLLCVHNGISFGPAAILLTFPFGVAAYVLGI